MINALIRQPNTKERALLPTAFVDSTNSALLETHPEGEDGQLGFAH